MLLMIGLLAASASALAAAKLTEATMIYEDYDGQRCEQTVVDTATLKEVQDMLERAAKNSATLDNCTMNCTLLCKVGEETLISFAVATDGCPFVTDQESGRTYRLEEDDWARLWQIYEQIQDAMGYDAALVF